jgi:hypothetical protein
MSDKSPKECDGGAKARKESDVGGKTPKESNPVPGSSGNDDRTRPTATQREIKKEMRIRESSQDSHTSIEPDSDAPERPPSKKSARRIAAELAQKEQADLQTARRSRSSTKKIRPCPTAAEQEAALNPPAAKQGHRQSRRIASPRLQEAHPA